MADPQTTLISGPFGSERVAVPEVTDPAAGAGAPQPDGPRVPLNDVTMAGEPAFDAARQAREDRAIRPDASIMESVGAAVNSWDTSRLVRRISRPRFDSDTPIDQFEYLQSIPMVLNEDEREYFLDVGRGAKSAQYAVDQIKDRRLSAQAIGDHPIAGIATAFVDPMWLVVPPALRVGKASPVAGRAVSGVSGAALGAAVTGSGEGPVSDEEVVFSMLINGAAATVFYRAGKGLQKADPEFPSKQLDDALATAQAGAKAAAKPHYKLVQEEKWEEVEVPATPAQYEWQPIRSPELDASKPGFSYQSKKFVVEFDNPIDKAAYIVAGKGKSKAHEAIKDWALQTGRMSEAELIKRGDEIRADLKAQAKAAPGDGTLKRTATDEFKPRMKQVLKEPGRAAMKEQRKVQDAVWEEVPPELKPGAVNTEPAKVAAAVEKALTQESRSRGLGRTLQWNMHKTMSNFGPVGKKVADLIYDNNSDLSITSMEAHRESILSSLRTHQVTYEDALRQAMADDGFGLDKMVNPMQSRQAYARQLEIERQVQQELFRREHYASRGQAIPTEGVNQRISKMADSLDALHKQALQEMKGAGVAGAENILERPGYLNRKWSSSQIDRAIDKFEASGLTREQALGKVHDLVALALRRANSMDVKLSRQIGQAIVDRALRKGYFEDSVFNAPGSPGQLAELRDILKQAGVAGDDMERALNVLRVATDDAGKAGFMKHRMDLDYRATTRVGNEEVSVMDLIDSRVTTIVDQYIQRVSTNSAMARKGLKKQSDVLALREELLKSVGEEQRKQAAELFDNTMAHLRGDPAGAKVDEKFRLIQAYGRSIALAWSGLWQLTEFATAMGEYGLRKTLKYAAQEIPGFKQIMADPDKATQRSLNNVLAEHSVASMRLRPYIARFEDGYEMDTTSALQLSAQTLGQMVPYANAMRYVHHSQAKIVGNLVLDRLEMAAKGNKQAREALAKYGLEYPVMDKLAKEIDAHGFNVDSWADDVWADVRPGLAKMMDSVVLKGRLGDVPAFAAFDQLGKFIFTYRTFVLTAHNKVLAGNLARNGAGAVGLVLLYQFPLAMAAVQAQNVIRGEGLLKPDDLVKKAVGQMGGIGLFSEPLKWATGESNSVGSPAMIPIDRAVKLFQAGAQLDGQKAASTALTMIPTVSAIPFVNGIAHQIKE